MRCGYNLVGVTELVTKASRVLPFLETSRYIKSFRPKRLGHRGYCRTVPP